MSSIRKDTALEALRAMGSAHEPSIKLYQEVMDNMPIRVFWKDTQGLYLGANSAFLKDAHCTSLSSLIGKSDYELPWKEGEALAFRRDDREVIETGQSKLNIEEAQTRADGSVGWLITNKIPLRDEQDRIIGVIGTYEDVTERKAKTEALRESEARFRTLFNSTFQYTGILSPDGTVLAINETATRLYGMQPEDPVGLYFPDTPFWSHDPEQRDKIVAAIEKAKVGEQFRDKLYHLPPNGEKVYIDFSLTPVFNCQGEVEMLIPEGRDITTQCIAESRLRVFNELLEKNVAKRTAELEAANKELTETLHELKLTQDELIQSEKLTSLGHLVSGLAHEVNTPLGVSVTSASFLSEQLKQLEALLANNQLSRAQVETFIEKSREGASLLQHNLTRASDLVGSLKHIAVEQSSEPHDAIDFMACLREVLQDLSPQLNKSNIEVSLTGPNQLLCATSPGSIAQIMTHFVMNSIQHAFHNESSPAISIQVEVFEEALLLTYTDNGCGMDDETCRQIYDPFFTTSRGQGASGLGMNIVFNLVTKKLGGGIKCFSHPGGGAEFLIRLPGVVSS